jgi:hypothetical protein
MAERKKLETAVTPKGVAIWPRLNTPDEYKGKLHYKTKLAFDADDPALEPLKAKVAELIDAEYDAIVADLTSKGKAGVAKKFTKRSIDDIFKPEEDEETGDETGRVIINAKMLAAGVSAKTGKAWTRKLSIFDAKGKKLNNPPFINGGSELKLSVELLPYAMPKEKEVGVSFRLEAAQVITLVTGGSRNAAGYGFGEEEGDEIDDVEESGSDFAAGNTSSDDDDDEL